MSEQNFYENQTPPDNGERPDYSYDWNGNEYTKKQKKGIGKKIAIAVVSMLLITAVVMGIAVALSKVQNVDTSTDASGVELNESDVQGNKKPSKPSSDSKDETSKENVSVPEFTPSKDSENDLSTVYTEIYEACSPSCCTIEVYVRNRLYSIGSGFVINAADGYIATNHHVIDSGDTVKVSFYNGESYEAEVVGSDSTTDIAVLKIEAEGLVQVEFGNSDNIRVGQNVVAIGTPYDLTLAGTMTQGIISGIARDVEVTNNSGKVIKTMTLLQTDCSINPGNSGGPLFDMSGNVIGINSMKLVDEQFEGIGFAIPITDAIKIFEKLIAGEEIGDSNIATATPQIGVTVYELEAGLEAYRIYPRCEYPKGLLVADIQLDSSAYMAGLSFFDIITDFNGETISTLDELTTALNKYKAGDMVTIKIFRFNRNLTSGEELSIQFRLDAAQ